MGDVKEGLRGPLPLLPSGIKIFGGLGDLKPGLRASVGRGEALTGEKRVPDSLYKKHIKVTICLAQMQHAFTAGQFCVYQNFTSFLLIVLF